MAERIRRSRKPQNGLLECLDCGLRPMEEFFVGRKARNGGQYPDSRCHTCRKIACVCRNQAITRAEYDRLVRQSGGACEICREPFQIPNFDHCHTTGMLRGVLCRRCNTGLGVFGDNPDLMDRASSYLRGHTSRIAGKQPTRRDVERGRKMEKIRNGRRSAPVDAQRVEPIGVLKLAGKWAARLTAKETTYIFGYFQDAATAAEAYRIGREKVLLGEIGPESVFAVGRKRDFSRGCGPEMRKRIRDLTVFDPIPTFDERMKSGFKRRL